jgi:prepilin-type N-terminal cleavage/methylation domain-containing protein
MNTSFNKNKRGFTLIETLAAITILLIALAGPLTIAAKGLNTAYYARDQITAFYLAQEGIEYIRNMRDAEALFVDINPVGATAWPGDLLGAVGLDSKFTIDATLPVFLADRTINPAAIEHCPTNTGCSPLMLSGGEVSTYGYAGSIETQFTREITISAVAANPAVSSDPYEFRVTSKVSWKSPLPNHSFTLVEDITKWHE